MLECVTDAKEVLVGTYYVVPTIYMKSMLAPSGEVQDEVGGSMTTLAALCTSLDLDMKECGDNSLIKNWNRIERIRVKQATKPKNSPLPQRVSELKEVYLISDGVRSELEIILGHLNEIILIKGVHPDVPNVTTLAKARVKLRGVLGLSTIWFSQDWKSIDDERK